MADEKWPGAFDKYLAMAGNPCEGTVCLLYRVLKLSLDVFVSLSPGVQEVFRISVELDHLINVTRPHGRANKISQIGNLI